VYLYISLQLAMPEYILPLYMQMHSMTFEPCQIWFRPGLRPGPSGRGGRGSSRRSQTF